MRLIQSHIKNETRFSPNEGYAGRGACYTIE
jgi:hypothetical protein